MIFSDRNRTTSMNGFPSFLLFMVVLLLTPDFVLAATERFTVVTPPDRSFVEGGLVSVVLTPPTGGMDEARVSVNGKVASFRVSTAGKYLCLGGITLASGMNRLRVILLKGGELAGENDLAVFFRSDLSAKAASAPLEYKKYVFHTPEREKNCVLCHQMKASRGDENPPTPRQSGCFTCHKKMVAGKFVHPPAAEWSCIACHNRKSKKPGGSALAADDSSCAGCHRDALAKWSGKEFRHGPADAGHCTACHDPHASEQPGLLRANATEICVSCHEEFTSKPHVIAGVSGKGGHPVRISPDPYRPGRDFTCASCHNPHAGDAPNFLNNYKASMSIHRFCLSCHNL